MTPRRRARCVALQVLYALDGADTLDPSAALASHLHQFGVPEEETDLTPEPVSGHAAENDAAPIAPFDEELALDLISGVCAHRPEIDDALAKLSRKWRVERLARVDRTILRIGLYELAHRKERTPARVALSEAIELAKRFGAEEAPAFVNGLLDSALELLGQGI